MAAQYNVEDFVAHVRRHGVARKNRFSASIPLPIKLVQALDAEHNGGFLDTIDPSGKLSFGANIVSQIMGGAKKVARTMNLMCVSASIPGITLGTTNGAWRGHEEKLVTNGNYEDMEMLFIMSPDGYERRIIEKWIGLARDHKTGHVGYYDDYVSEMLRIAQDTGGTQNSLYHVDLKEAYPVSVANVDFDRQSSDDFQIISVMFAFRRVAPMGEFEEFGSKIDLSGFTPAQIVSDVMSGDFEGAVQGATDLFVDIQDGTYQGEALGMYQMVKSLGSQIGMDGKQAESVLGALKGDLFGSGSITDIDKSSLGGVIDNILGKL